MLYIREKELVYIDHCIGNIQSTTSMFGIILVYILGWLWVSG